MVEEHVEQAAYFEKWYADMTGASVKDEIQQRHLGLPPELLSTSLLTWQGIAEVAEALELARGELLVDLACGRGGYGLELASRAQAGVLGVDFAPSALEAARVLAATRGIDADYRLGDLVATGLADGAADAVVVIDAIQFPLDPAAAYREIARILRPGGRVVLICWEAVDHEDQAVPKRAPESRLALRARARRVRRHPGARAPRVASGRACDVGRGGGSRPGRRPCPLVLPRRGRPRATHIRPRPPGDSKRAVRPR